MDVKIVQELKPYSFEQIANWINQEEEEAKKIVDSLVLLNILRKLTSHEQKIELEDLLDVESLEEIEDSVNKNMYVFKYVGMVMVGDCCFFVYPKYILDIDNDKQNKFKKFKQILSVIRKYQAKEQFYNLDGLQEMREFNLLAFTLDLLQDYHENGIYSNDKTIVEENGFGEILWDKTINEQNIYFSDGVPVYLDLYTVNNVINEEDLFRRLHRCIISRCSEEIKEILEVLEIDQVSISSERIEDFGSKEYLTYSIKQEISQQFITRKQEVLHRMISYINRDNTQNSQEKISFVGTSSFNLVWEDVCSYVMEDSLNKTLSELGLKPYGDKKSSDLLIDLIPKPKWKHLKSGKEHDAKKTLTPDLISVSNGKLSIYDAKYYKIHLNESGVSRQPGVGDVTKQYLYELAYKELAEENNLLIDKNAFIMPTDSSEEESIGIASIDLFSKYGDGITFNDIEVILKPCEDMFEKYLNN